MAYDYAALKAEIATDPLKIGYSAMSDDAVAASLNAANRPGPNVLVPITTLMRYLRDNALWLPIKKAAAAGNSDGALAAVDYNEDPRTQSLDMSLPIVDAMLGDLLQHGLLSADQITDLKAFGAPPVSRANELGWAPAAVSAGDIATVRGA